MSFVLTNEGSVRDAEGRIVFFVADHFLRDIVEGDCCLICGATVEEKTFNDEHVIPDWMLRRYQLHNKTITIPGGSQFRYDQYKVPCCAECNAQMGLTLEDRMANLFANGYLAVVNHLKNEGPLLLYQWLNLLFLKTHLKDRSLRLHRDKRVESIQISELYDWPVLHHVHCVARSFYTGAELDPKAIGSIFLWPAKVGTPLGNFDYGDYYEGQAIFVRAGEVFIVAVLNDACGAFTILQEIVGRFTGPLSPWQCREVLAHAAYANLLIDNRPVFRTEVDPVAGSLVITADVETDLRMNALDESVWDGILRDLLAPVVETSPISEEDKSEILSRISEGRVSTLFDDSGAFIDRPL